MLVGELTDDYSYPKFKLGRVCPERLNIRERKVLKCLEYAKNNFDTFKFFEEISNICKNVNRLNLSIADKILLPVDMDQDEWDEINNTVYDHYIWQALNTDREAEELFGRYINFENRYFKSFKFISGFMLRTCQISKYENIGCFKSDIEEIIKFPYFFDSPVEHSKKLFTLIFDCYRKNSRDTQYIPTPHSFINPPYIKFVNGDIKKRLNNENNRKTIIR